MAARIIYEGKARAGEGGGGDMFEGLTLYIGQRVPMRLHWEGLVKSNGGRITPIDRAADIVIADHLFPNPAEGSVSWKWVEDSIKEGALKDRTPYTRAVPVRTSNTGQHRSGPRAVPKQTRTPFTAQDDLELRRFCLRHVELGTPMAGNIIFEQFARTHPRHTMHSWRDRWQRKLQFETLTEEDREAAIKEQGEEAEADAQEQQQEEHTKAQPIPRRVMPVSARNAPVPPRTRPEKAVTPQTITATVKAENISPQPNIRFIGIPSATNGFQQHNSSPSTSQSAPSPQVRADNDFTEEDVQLLLDEYDAIMNLDEEQVIDAWLAWERVYPRHTAQQWMNYFKREIKDRVNSPRKNVPNTQSPPIKSNPASSLRRSPRISAQTPSPIDSPSAQLLNSVRASQVQHVHSRSLNGMQAAPREIKDSQGSSNKTLSSNFQYKSSQEAREMDEAEANFNDNVLAFAERYFPNHEVDLRPEILGVPITLYQLWNLVASEDFASAAQLDEEDGWPDVAAVLGFDDANIELAGERLRVCYNELLLLLQNYVENNEEPTESQTIGMVEAQLHETLEGHSQEECSDADDDLSEDDRNGANQPISYDSTSRKRSSPHEFEHSNGKRLRVDKGKGRADVVLEIPSTPEEEIKCFKRPDFKNPSPLRNTVIQQEVTLTDHEEDEYVSHQAMVSPTPIKPKLTRQAVPPLPRPSSNSSGVSAHRQRMSTPSVRSSVEPVKVKQEQRPVSKGSSGEKANGSNYSDGSRPPTGHSGVPSSVAILPTRATAQKSAFAEFTERMGGLGYSQVIITKAIRATSLKIGGPATRVMESLRSGHGIPDDIAGVWTEADDRSIQRWREAIGSGQRNKAQHIHDRLAAKHGVKGIEARNQWLLKFPAGN